MWNHKNDAIITSLRIYAYKYFIYDTFTQDDINLCLQQRLLQIAVIYIILFGVYNLSKIGKIMTRGFLSKRFSLLSDTLDTFFFFYKVPILNKGL